MWFKNGLKAQKLLAQGVWSLHAKLEWKKSLIFLIQKRNAYDNRSSNYQCSDAG